MNCAGCTANFNLNRDDLKNKNKRCPVYTNELVVGCCDSSGITVQHKTNPSFLKLQN